MEAFEMALLFDYYGGMLTEKQCEYIDMRYNQDLSLGEIAEAQGVSRQAVFDNLARTEALLHRMEEKIGALRRDVAVRRVSQAVVENARHLLKHPDAAVKEAAQSILTAVQELEE